MTKVKRKKDDAIHPPKQFFTNWFVREGHCTTAPKVIRASSVCHKWKRYRDEITKILGLHHPQSLIKPLLIASVTPATFLAFSIKCYLLISTKMIIIASPTRIRSHFPFFYGRTRAKLSSREGKKGFLPHLSMKKSLASFYRSLINNSTLKNTLALLINKFYVIRSRVCWFNGLHLAISI